MNASPASSDHSSITPTLVGTKRAIDSNVSPSGTAPSALASGSSNLALDFGYYKLGTISGTRGWAVYQRSNSEVLSADAT